MSDFKDSHLRKLVEMCQDFLKAPAAFGYDTMSDAIIYTLDMMPDDGLVELAQAIARGPE